MYLALGIKMMLISLKGHILESCKKLDGEEGSEEFTVIHRRSPSCFMFYLTGCKGSQSFWWHQQQRGEGLGLDTEILCSCSPPLPWAFFFLSKSSSFRRTLRETDVGRRAKAYWQRDFLVPAHSSHCAQRIVLPQFDSLPPKMLPSSLLPLEMLRVTACSTNRLNAYCRLLDTHFSLHNSTSVSGQRVCLLFSGTWLPFRLMV